MWIIYKTTFTTEYPFLWASFCLYVIMSTQFIRTNTRPQIREALLVLMDHRATHQLELCVSMQKELEVLLLHTESHSTIFKKYYGYHPFIAPIKDSEFLRILKI